MIIVEKNVENGKFLVGQFDNLMGTATRLAGHNNA